MTAQVETHSRAVVFAQRATSDEGAPGLELLGAMLVTALEQALLAANRFLGALDSATGRQTNTIADQAQVQQILTLIDPSEIRRPPACGCASALPEVQSTVPTPMAGLTQREREVLRLLAAGHSNRRIAQRLCLSPRTVQRHIANAYPKIGAHNRAEATAYALRHGLT